MTSLNTYILHREAWFWHFEYFQHGVCHCYNFGPLWFPEDSLVFCRMINSFADKFNLTTSKIFLVTMVT